MLLGCIADDLTGATDLGLTLKRGGMRTVQVIGVPDPCDLPDGADAVVVALKSRTIPVRDAVDQSLRSADILLKAGAKQLFFKYCSTFDSTDQGNIGPVIEALLERLGDALTIACPAFPANERTVYRGHLFVGDLLLSDSPMKDHPLTPMRDANLVRVLARQTNLAVGLVPLPVVEAGADAIASAFGRARAASERIVIIDAVNDAHLSNIGSAARDLQLVTGGSGIALGLADNFRRAGLLSLAGATGKMTAPSGRPAILAGSCSAATRAQVAMAETAGMPSLRLDPIALANGRQTAEAAVNWALSYPVDAPILIYSSVEPSEMRAAQNALGSDRAAALVERTLSEIGRALVQCGATRIIVAGGETSGAVVQALEIKALEIGPEIDPGVPWTRSLSAPHLCLALKSGNFGGSDLFLKAWSMLQ